MKRTWVTHLIFWLGILYVLMPILILESSITFLLSQPEFYQFEWWGALSAETRAGVRMGFFVLSLSFALFIALWGFILNNSTVMGAYCVLATIPSCYVLFTLLSSFSVGGNLSLVILFEVSFLLHFALANWHTSQSLRREAKFSNG